MQKAGGNVRRNNTGDMRRKDREITDVGELLAIINRCKVCRLGLCDDSQPYVVPLNFGYVFYNECLTLYFHGAHEGRKIDMIRKNNKACFEIDCDHQLVTAEKACNYSYTFSSIIGFGTIEFINEIDEKKYALNILMKHQIGNKILSGFEEPELNSVTLYKMKIDSFTGKQKTPEPSAQ